MKIYPQDLGRVGYQALLLVRALERHEPYTGPLPLAAAMAPHPLTPLQRVWTRGAGVPDEAAAYAAPAFVECRRAIWRGRPLGTVLTLAWGLIGVWCLEAIFAANYQVPSLMQWLYPSWALTVAGVVSYSVALRPRRVLRQMHEPVTDEELRRLRDLARDPLAGDFLSVVQLLLPLPTRMESESEKALRGALFALGEAIEELPPQPLPVVQGDPNQMRDQARRLTEQARGEPDTVVAASLERRAQSLSRRAQAVASIAVLLRRNGTLREEVSEQIETLRTSVAAFSVGSRQSPHDLADLAASIQHVAEQASAIAVARTELDSVYATLLPVAEPETATTAWQKVH